MIQILAISGSLRHSSSNTTLLQAAVALAPQGVTITIFSGLADLPHFNPDLEGSKPAEVLDLRSRIATADGILICSPEYAHGLPGALKNALDWIVGSGELVDKPVALLNASPSATHAEESLKETITVMSARVIATACLRIPLQGSKRTVVEITSDPTLASLLNRALTKFASAIKNPPAPLA